MDCTESECVYYGKPKHKDCGCLNVPGPTSAPSAAYAPLRWRKKAVIIEAQQIDRFNGERLAAWCGGQWLSLYGRGDRGEDISHILIRTLEGEMRANLGDWIIKGIAGEYYPCKPSIFASTYELAPTDGAAPDTERSGTPTPPAAPVQS